MTLLTGAIVSLLVSLLRKLSNKIGVEMAKVWTLILLFFVALVYASLSNNGIISEEMIANASKIFASAIVFYEVIIKAVISPVFEGIKGGKS